MGSQSPKAPKKALAAISYQRQVWLKEKARSNQIYVRLGLRDIFGGVGVGCRSKMFDMCVYGQSEKSNQLCRAAVVGYL